MSNLHIQLVRKCNVLAAYTQEAKKFIINENPPSTLDNIAALTLALDSCERELEELIDVIAVVYDVEPFEAEE